MKEKTQETEFKAVYPGFRTIPIQKLNPKPPKTASKKKQQR